MTLAGVPGRCLGVVPGTRVCSGAWRCMCPPLGAVHEAGGACEVMVGGSFATCHAVLKGCGAAALQQEAMGCTMWPSGRGLNWHFMFKGL